MAACSSNNNNDDDIDNDVLTATGNGVRGLLAHLAHEEGGAGLLRHLPAFLLGHLIALLLGYVYALFFRYLKF